MLAAGIVVDRADSSANGLAKRLCAKLSQIKPSRVFPQKTNGMDGVDFGVVRRASVNHRQVWANPNARDLAMRDIEEQRGRTVESLRRNSAARRHSIGSVVPAPPPHMAARYVQ